MKMEPLGKENYVLLVLDQVLAAKLLWGEVANWGFYEWHFAPWNEGERIAYFRTDEGKLIRAHEATREQLDRRRDSWLGKEFKFDIPSPPKVGGQLLDFHYI